MQPSWEAGLIQRGIFQAAVKIAAWKSHTYNQMDGWLIPTQALDGSAGRARFKPFGGKTQWLPGQAPLVPYYIPQGRAALESAIQAANGVLYIVEGETDLLTFLELGFYNVLSPSSGINSPLPSLVDDLRDLRVKHVVQSCDNDHDKPERPGERFGADVRGLLEGSGITHDARIMPRYVDMFGEVHYSKDPNEFWQLVKFDRPAMLEALEKAPAANLEGFTPQEPKKPAKRPTTAQDGTFKERVRAAVNVLAVYESRTAKFKHKKSGDDLIAMACCPFHNDKTPSLAVYADGGCTCRGACRKSWDLFGFVMERDGIDFPAALDLLAGLAGIERPAPSTTASAGDLDAVPNGTKTHQNAPDSLLTNVSFPAHAREASRFSFAGGIPARLISVFLNLRRDGWLGDHTPAIAVYMTLHELIASGVMGENDAFGALEMETSPRQLGEKFALKGLRQLEKAGFLEAAGSHQAGKGKPRQLWTLKPLLEALEAFKTRRALVYREQEFSGVIPDTITPAFYPDLEESAALEAAQVENELRAPLYAACADQIEQANQRINQTLEKEERAFRWKGVQMEAGAWSSGAAFRRAFALHQAVYRMEQGKTIARRFAARELGVKPDTLYDIRRRVGIATDAEYKESAYTPAALEKLPESHLIEVVTPQGSMTASAGRDTVTAFAAAAMSKGESVSIRVRTASRERFQTEDEKAAVLAALEAKRQQAQETTPQKAVERRTPPPDELSAYHSPRYIAVQLNLTPQVEELAPKSGLYDFVREIPYSPENGAKSENAPELDPAGGGSEIPFSSGFFGFSEESPTTGGDRKSSGNFFHLKTAQNVLLNDPAPDTDLEQNFVQSKPAPTIPTPAQQLEAALEFGLTWEGASLIERSRIDERANEIRLGIDRAGSLVWARWKGSHDATLRQEFVRI